MGAPQAIRKRNCGAGRTVLSKDCYEHRKIIGTYVDNTKEYRHLDLFSGIGGFSLAAKRIWGKAHKIVAFCEIDLFCQKVLGKHWPKVPIIGDIRNIQGSKYKPVELVSGGFPCQPFSQAGKQGSKEDNRYLWPEMLRVIEEARPEWVVCENVTGIINLALDEVLASLELAGYATEPFNIPACAVNAPHRRERIWIVAYPTCRRNTCGYATTQEYLQSIDNKPKTVEDFLPFPDNWKELAGNTEPLRTNDGIPSRLDKDRCKALGNAIVPQVAEAIFGIIKWIDQK